jgi:16S rRNA processing protein RimM
VANYIPLGVVARPFGIRGEIKVKPYNRLTTWFDRAETVWLRPRPEDEPSPYRVLKTRRHQDFIVLTLDGVRDRDGADALKGHEAVTPEDKLEPLAENEFYWYQLIGLKAETEDGTALGEVVRIEETAPELSGNDVLVAFGQNGETQIPATTEAIVKVDLAGGRIRVRRESLD